MCPHTVSQRRPQSVNVALQGTQQLTQTLQHGWQLLRSGDAAEERPTCGGGAPGPRGLQQRFAQRRTQIGTVSVPDLQQLSSMLAAN